MPLDAAVAKHLSVKNPFSRYSYFADASIQELETLTRIRTIHHFEEGQKVPLTFNGDEGFYYIHDGYSKVILRYAEETETIRIAGPRDLVGYARWYSRMGEYQPETISNVTASFFKKQDFLDLQTQSAYIANEVLRWLMTILVSQEQRIFSLKERTAKGRVASTLVGLHQQFGSAIGGSNSIVAAPIDRKTLADLSGVAVEVLSRVLGELESDNIIARKGRVIVVVDVNRLQRAGRV